MRQAGDGTTLTDGDGQGERAVWLLFGLRAGRGAWPKATGQAR